MSAISPAAVETLQRLPSLLAREGYVELLTVHGAPRLDFDAVAARLAELPPPLGALLSLFYLRDEVADAALAPALGEAELEDLAEMGVLLRQQGKVSTGGLCALPLFGQLVFVPAPGQASDAYFGDDSAELAQRITPAHHARCLDLQAGPGHLAVRCAALAAHVLAIDSSPVAVACAELNAVLNGVSERMEVRQGTLDSVVAAGERFDFVVAQPATLPFSPGFPATGRHDPEDDGTLPLRRILTALPDLLEPDGLAQLSASVPGGDAGPGLRSALAELASARGLGIHVTLLRRASLSPEGALFDYLAQRCRRPGPDGHAEARARLGENFTTRGVRWLYWLALSAARSAHPGVKVTPLAS